MNHYVGVGSRRIAGYGIPAGRAIVARPGTRRKDSRPLPRGFTLLEIILALAILAGSLTALGEVMRLANQNAAMAGDETEAQILASTVMDELISGAQSLTAVDQVEFDTDTDPPWVYSIELEETEYVELAAVRVLVEQELDSKLQPARFELVRWLPNPGYIPTEAGEESSSSSASSNTTSGSSARSGSSSAGGGQ